MSAPVATGKKHKPLALEVMPKNSTKVSLGYQVGGVGMDEVHALIPPVLPKK